jgi:hypothetical protein
MNYLRMLLPEIPIQMKAKADMGATGLFFGS